MKSNHMAPSPSSQGERQTEQEVLESLRCHMTRDDDFFKQMLLPPPPPHERTTDALTPLPPSVCVWALGGRTVHDREMRISYGKIPPGKGGRKGEGAINN